jgi:hypothetical protein
MKKIVQLTLFVILALTWEAGVLVAGEPDLKNHRVVAQVTWIFEAETLEDLVAEADLIVLAEHGLAKPGRTAGHGEGVVPFTLHGFVVQKVIKGVLEEPILLVEQTGGRLPGGEMLKINDGGAFKPTAQYLLFLESAGNGLYYQINHQGRFAVEHDRLVGVDHEDGVISVLDGERLEPAMRRIGALHRETLTRSH